MELKMRTRNVGTDPACSPTLMILRAATGWCRMGMRPILTRQCANAAPQTTALKPRCMGGHGATMARPQCGWGRFATRKRMAVKYFTALWIRQPWLWSQTKQLIQRYQESLSSLKSAYWPCSFCSIIAIIHTCFCVLWDDIWYLVKSGRHLSLCFQCHRGRISATYWCLRPALSPGCHRSSWDCWVWNHKTEVPWKPQETLKKAHGAWW